MTLSTQTQPGFDASASDRAAAAAWAVSLGRTETGKGASPLSTIVSRSDGLALTLERGGPVADVQSAAAPDATSVVFEGLLYNALELSRELDLDVSAPAASLILAAYARWGEGSVRRLKGIYAIVIWDAPRKTLLALRDRLGLYPLFYAKTTDGCILSPDIKLLSGDTRVRSGLNRLALAAQLAHRWPESDETHFEGVARVPPGNVLRAANGSYQLDRYWHPSPPGEPRDWLEEKDLGAFNQLLDQAVSRAMSRGRSAIFLSGGLDSISVAAVAAERARESGAETPIALSLAFPHPECNEEERQRAVSGDLGLPLILKSLDEAIGFRGLLRAGMDATIHAPFPLINIYHPAYHGLMDEAAKKGVRVVLGGGGGDEWLTVTPYLAADLISSLRLRELLELWRSTRRAWPISRRRAFRNIFWTFGARALLMAIADQVAPGLRPALHRRHIPGTIRPWIAPDPALRRALEDRAIRSAPRYRLGHFYTHGLRASVEHALVSMEMEEQFVMYRRFGVQVLQPYWDPDLIEFLTRVPPALLNREGRTKGLVRRALAERFPDLGFERQKKVVGINFVRERIRLEAREVWKALGGVRVLGELGVVDANKAGAAVATTLDRGVLVDLWKVWDIINVESWARHNA